MLLSALTSLVLIVGPSRNVTAMKVGVRIVGVVFTFLLFGISGFGVAVATGLVFLKDWARKAAIACAVFLAWFGALAFAIGVVLMDSTPTTGSFPVRMFGLVVDAALFSIGIWWLLLFTRKNVKSEFAGAATESAVAPRTDFPDVESEASISCGSESLSLNMPRARAVLGRLLLATVGSAIFVLVGARVLLGRNHLNSPIVLALAEVCFYCSLFFLLYRLLRKANMTPGLLFGAKMDWKAVRHYWFLPVMLGGTMLASLFLVFYPLSFAFAPFVDRWLLKSQDALVVSGGGVFSIGNLLNFLVAVVLAPFVEEFVFRGILMTRWSVKWGTPRGILISSLLFGIMHTEVLGHMFFGYVMAVLYIETKSLYVPMIFHAINNGFVWLVTLRGPSSGRPSHQTLAQFQSAGHFGMIVVLLFIPWAIWFLRNHFPKSNWKPPSLRA